MDTERAIRQFKEIKEYSDRTKMRLAAEGWDSEWKTLVAIMMSAQTRDETTISVCEELFKRYPSPKDLSKASIEEIEKMIRKVNYHKSKARNIKEVAGRISTEGISHKIDELIKLPGVGRKTASVFLSEINKTQSVAVDTHVFRISRKLGWAKEKTSDKVSKELESLFPERYWSSINPTLVRFGKEYGRSKKREDEILEKINS